jgi:carbohydrate kinase (thermoresistant glucokinase family)
MGSKTTVAVLIGAMGCGKTTIGQKLAETLGWQFFDADDFHPKQNVEKMRAGTALTDEDRLPWLEMLHNEIQSWLGKEQNTILACSALKQAYRDILGVDQVSVITVHLKGSFEQILERLESRDHSYMNNTLLQSQLDTLEEPDDGYMVDITPTPETIVRTIIDFLNNIP